MRIIETHEIVIAAHTVERHGETYKRRAFQTGKITWTAKSYDGECDEEILEEEFQKLMKKKDITYCRGPAPSYIS
jgi:hypothetical protein